jgi:hypothetical protein
MNAAMFGMIIPDRNVPNFWTAILVPLVFFVAVSVIWLPFRGGAQWALVHPAVLSSRPRHGRTTSLVSGQTIVLRW